MKDWRNIALAVTIILCLFLGWTVFFQGDSAYKERVKNLEKENRELRLRRAELDAEIAKRKAAFDSLQVVEFQLESELNLLEAETRILREQAKRSKEDLDAVRERIAETRKKISELRKNPAKRKDTDLINSLKLKTQK